MRRRAICVCILCSVTANCLVFESRGHIGELRRQDTFFFLPVNSWRWMRTNRAALRCHGLIASLRHVDDCFAVGEGSQPSPALCVVFTANVCFFLKQNPPVCVLNVNLPNNGCLYSTVTFLSDLHPSTHPLLLPTKALR